MPKSRELDRATVASIAVVAYAAANLLHEAAGHGGTCLAVGGELRALSAIYCDCDDAALGALARGAIRGGGTAANLIAAAVAYAVLRLRLARPTPGRYFTWLFLTLNLLQATGYWLFSGIGNVGDWAHLVAGWEPRWAFRLGLTLLGGVGYWLSIRVSLRELSPLLGDGPDRLARGRRLTLLPYLVGGLLYVTAGLPNPVSFWLVLISAAAASFGGASALAWMSDLLRSPAYPASAGPGLSIERSPGWIFGAAAAALLFVVVLGPSIRF